MYDREIDYLEKRWSGQISARNPRFLSKLGTLAQRRCIVGMFGMQSAGKSTLLNGLIGFPVLPSLMTRGTVCALTLEYGSRPLLLVYPDAMQTGKPVEIPGIFPTELFQRMLEYVCRCVNELVFYPENINWFLPEIKAPGALTPADFQLDPQDGRHGLLLVLILLNAYFTGTGGRSINEQRVNRERRALLLQVGIDPETAFSLKLQWNSSRIPKDVCLIDMPGLGSDEKSSANSLRELALIWASRCDILLCLTTGEAIGGLVHETLKEILSGTSDDGSTLPVVIINRAELILSLETSRTAAKQMIPHRNPMSFFLSSVAGEYCYLDSGIPVERTQFWRRDFLPALRMMKPEGEITGADRKLALEQLRERFTNAYPCEREDGTHMPVSLQSFFQEEFPALVERQNLEIFKRVYAEDKNIASYIRDLVAEEWRLFRNFDTFLEDMLDLWLFEAETAMEKFCADLLDASNAAFEIMADHQRRIERFFQWWLDTVNTINAQLSQSAVLACDDFHPVFGTVRCSGDNPYALDDSMKNDLHLKELYLKVLDFNIDGIVNQGLQEGENITIHTWREADELWQSLRLAISRFRSSLKALPEICREHFCMSGFSRDQFDYHFSVAVQKLSETMYDDVIPQPSELSAATPQFTGFVGWERPCWRNIQFEWVRRAIDSVARSKKRGGIIFSRKQLIHQLEFPMVPTQSAVELIAPLVDRNAPPVILDYLLNLAHNCRSLHERLIGSRNHIFKAYHRMASKLFEPLEDRIRCDYDILKDIQYIIE